MTVNRRVENWDVEIASEPPQTSFLLPSQGGRPIRSLRQAGLDRASLDARREEIVTEMRESDAQRHAAFMASQGIRAPRPTITATATSSASASQRAPTSRPVPRLV